MKHIRVSSGENIWVFDDVFRQSESMAMELFCQKSFYSTGSTSTTLNAHIKHTFMQSTFSKDDVDSLGVLSFEGAQQFKSLIDKYTFTSARVVAASRSDKYFYHSDTNSGNFKVSGLTLVSFVNTTWDKDWGSEVLFASDKGEAEIVVGYKPNRVVIFDSSIIHKPAPSAIDAPQYAYMFVAQFLKDNA